MSDWDKAKESYYKSYTGKLSEAGSDYLIKAADKEIERLREALAEVREVWAGSDAFIPVTAPEAYSQRLCKQMYEIAIKALKGDDDDI